MSHRTMIVTLIASAICAILAGAAVESIVRLLLIVFGLVIIMS